jgi:hypothetical protein
MGENNVTLDQGGQWETPTRTAGTCVITFDLSGLG